MQGFLYLITVFAVGGCFSAIAQLLLDLTRLSPARVLVIYVVAGVALGGLGLYEPLHRLAGAGASVPLVGFGAAVARGVREAVAAQGLLGARTGGLTAASGGTAAALVFGYLAALVFQGTAKRT